MLQTSLFFHFRAKHSHLIYKQPSTGLEIKAKMGTHWSTTDPKTITGQGEISSFSNVSFEHISGDFFQWSIKNPLKLLTICKSRLSCRALVSILPFSITTIYFQRVTVNLVKRKHCVVLSHALRKLLFSVIYTDTST